MAKSMTFDEFLGVRRHRDTSHFGQSTGLKSWMQALPCEQPKRVPQRLLAHHKSQAVSQSALHVIANKIGRKAHVRTIGGELWVAVSDRN